MFSAFSVFSSFTTPGPALFAGNREDHRPEDGPNKISRLKRKQKSRTGNTHGTGIRKRHTETAYSKRKSGTKKRLRKILPGKNIPKNLPENLSGKSFRFFHGFSTVFPRFFPGFPYGFFPVFENRGKTVEKP